MQNDAGGNDGILESKKTQTWQRSVGSLSSSKAALGSLVKKKTPVVNQEKVGAGDNPAKSSSETSEGTSQPNEIPAVTSGMQNKTTRTEQSDGSKQGLTGLGLVGSYSDSDSSNGSESD